MLEKTDFKSEDEKETTFKELAEKVLDVAETAEDITDFITILQALATKSLVLTV